MIPISAAPKRFVAALNTTRFVSRRVLTQRSIPAVAAYASPVFACNAKVMSNLPGRHFSFPLGSVCNFSTLSKPADELNVALCVDTDAKPLNLFGLRENSWWTGASPATGSEKQGFKDGVIRSLPLVSLSPNDCTREAVQNYYDNTWALTETLLAALQGEEAFTRPPYHDLRHPMIFYYGHPAVFYVNKLRVAGLIKEPINPYFESVFEVGVDEMSWDDLSKNKMAWPTVAEVHAYRKKVYLLVSGVIQSLPANAFQSINQSSPLWSIVMCMEHERIHIETSSVLLSELPHQFVQFPKNFPNYHPSAVSDLSKGITNPKAGVNFPVNEMIPISEQTVHLGKPKDFPCYGWDNEYGSRSYTVPAFRASKFKISNGEFLDFVKAGGYSNRTFWSNAGWEWRTFRNAKWPFYWQPTGPQGLHQYNLRLIFDIVAMPWDWPVAVNLHEAEAYARWKSTVEGKSYRLMSELEHNAIRDPVDVANMPYDKVDPVMSADKQIINSANVGLQYGSMTPVNAYPANSKGFYDVNGNAWEWNVDFFCALPGFKVHPYYEDFSSPCFDGLHNVIQSASFISTGNLASNFSRFHFRPHFLQHSGFRITETNTNIPLITADTDAPGPFVGRYPYRKSLSALEAESRAHAGAHDEDATSFGGLNYYFSKSFNSLFNVSAKPPMVMLRDLVRSFSKQVGINESSAHVLEIGCGSGGLSFLLAETFKGVIGLDHSQAAIKLANSIRLGTNNVSVPSGSDISFPNSRTNIDFRMSDPMCVPAELCGFDTVVISDVLDKVTSPNSVLGRLGGSRGLVKDGGLLVVYCGYDWDENATPSTLWLGATESSVRPTPDASAADLVKRLEPHFNVVHQATIPFYWQTTANDLKGKLMNVAVFQKKPSTN